MNASNYKRFYRENVMCYQIRNKRKEHKIMN